MNEFSLRFLSLNSNFSERTKKFFKKDKKLFQKKTKMMMKKVQFSLSWTNVQTPPNMLLSKVSTRILSNDRRLSILTLDT